MSGGRGGTQCTRPPSSHPSPCCADGYGQLVVHMFAQEISMHLWNAYPHGHEPSSGTSGEGDQILPCVASVSCSQGGQGWTNLLVREQGHSGPSEASSSWVLALELAAPQDPGDEHAGSDVVSIATGNSSDAQLGEWTRGLKQAQTAIVRKGLRSCLSLFCLVVCLIFGCAESSLLSCKQGLPFTAWLLLAVASLAEGSRAWPSGSWHTGFAALWHVDSSRARD